MSILPRRDRRVGTSISVLVLFSLMAAAHAQSPVSIGTIGEPTLDSDPLTHGARASCDSQILPKAGFVISGPVPGKEGECYWDQNPVSASLDEPRPDGRPALDKARVVIRGAIDILESTLRSIEVQRSAALSEFWGDYDTCGQDEDCRLTALNALFTILRALDSLTAGATESVLLAVQNQRRPDPKTDRKPGSGEIDRP